MIKGMKVKEYYRKYRENNPEKVREHDRKYREKNPNYFKNWYQENPDYMKKYKQNLRLQALEIYDGKCQFQAQTITIEGKKHHFKSCDNSWNDIIVEEVLIFHHTKGNDGKEQNSEVHRRIIEHGIQDDIQLLCLVHHKLADIRDGTDASLWQKPSKPKDPCKNVKKLFKRKR